MLKITYIENLDPMTRETIRMAPIRVSKNTEFYRIEKNENSAPFYKYFNDRFAYEPSLCIIYDKDSETICSNCCELLNVYITILHGIDSNEIEENTGVYKSYLNSLYLFDSCQGKL